MGKKHEAIKVVEKADIRISREAAGSERTMAGRVLGWSGALTDQPPLYAMSAGVVAAGLIRRDGRVIRTGLRMVLAHAIGIGAKTIVKHAVDRTRPNMLIRKGHYESGKGRRMDKAYNSFPSGHTVGAAALARAVAREYPEQQLPSYGLATTTAIGRIAGQDHFASDTAAGALIGVGAEALADLIIATVSRSGPAKPSKA